MTKFQEKHGGEGAIKRLQFGQPLTGLAAQAEAEIVNELDTQGRTAILEKNAIRLQAAAELFWGGICAAAEAGDLKQLDGFIACFGWLTSCANRGWEALAKDSQQNTKARALTALAKDAKGWQNTPK